MSKSEIFDSFVKIAQEKGLVNDSKSSKKKLEETGRAGSDDISTIEALYGVKPNAPSGAEYKKNIMEAAHPNSVVVSPSYDKLNGLVENNNERQNILLHIVNKPVNGHITHHKYAQKELILSLVRVGNDLDNHDQDKLRALADHCLLQSSDRFEKKGAAALPIAGVAAVALILGSIYLKQHMRFVSDGFIQDNQKLLAEVDDLLTSNSNWGVGYEYTPEFLQVVSELKQKVTEYAGVVGQVLPIIERIQIPQDGAALKEQAKQPADPEIPRAIKVFRDATLNIWPFIEQVHANFNDENYKQRQIKDKGFLSKMVDAPQIFHGGKGLVADDFDDVKHALETYMLDIKKINETLGNTVDFAQLAQKRLQAALTNAPAQAPTNPTGTNPPAQQPGLAERALSNVSNMFSTPAIPAAASARRTLEEKLGIDELDALFTKVGK